MTRAFAAFLAELMPSGADYAAARALAGAVLPRLRRRFPGVAAPDGHLIAGSVGKHTALRPVPPVDLYIVLPGEPDPDAAREELAMALDLGPAALRDGWRVTVPLPGGLVAVVPCLARDGAFLIPGPAGWRLSNPAAELAAFRLLDQSRRGRPMVLLALVKAWIRQCGVPMASFTAEMLVREFFAERPGGHTPAALLAEFLSWARRRTPVALPLPGGRGARLTVDAAWHGLAEAAYWRCVLAERLSADAMAAAAEWRHLFGQRFPTLDLPAAAALPCPPSQIDC